MQFRFADPLAFALIPLLFAVLWHHLRRGRQTKPGLGYSDLALVRWSASARPSWEDRIPLVLAALAILLLIAALARPQAGLQVEDSSSTGIDIVLALDTSGSMQAEDLLPNRLAAARDVSMEFVKQRPGDRIGLVIFGGVAITQCPLTTDHDSMLTMLENTKLDMTRVQGTAVGTAIATAVNRLKDVPGKSKVIILLTDGRNNAGEIEPLAAAKLAAQFGIRVYTIGAAGRGPAPVTVDDPIFGPRVMRMAEDLDEDSLRKIADATGGRFFRATDNASLTGIYDEINRLEKTTRPTKDFVDYRELYPWLLIPGILLLVLAAGLERTVLQEVP
ncbi:MAG: VWA domain-containing protein [Armatimonadetes bacterium]|nr:VWA domain-containing protein [Armatimonadota bacterium]